MTAGRRISIPAIVATVAVVGTLIAALVVLGPPSAERGRRLDTKRTEELGRISFALDRYWNRRSALPSSLDTLVSDHDGLDAVPSDPVTKSPFEYSVTGPKAYRLCATFDQRSEDDRDGVASAAFYNDATFYAAPRSWRHGVGHTCFDLMPRDRKA